MASLKGIFEGARENIRRGKSAINKVVSINQSFTDRVETYNDRYDERLEPANEWVGNRVPFGLEREYESSNWEDMQERNEEEGDSIEVYSHEFWNKEDSVWGDNWGSERNNIGVDVLGYETSGNGTFDVGRDRLIVGADASGSAYLGRVEAEVGAGPVGLSGDAMVGVNADASADLTFDLSEREFGGGFEAGGVLGAEANADASLDLGIADAEVGVTGVAGLAADLEGDIGFDDGKITVDLGGKAALGLGGGFDTEFTIDGGAIVSGTWDAGAWTIDRAGAAGGWTLDRAGAAGGWTVDRASDVGGWTVDRASDIGGFFNPFD